MRETWVQPLGWEDTLEKGMATPSSVLAWRTPWTEEPGGPWGGKESDTPKRLSTAQPNLKMYIRLFLLGFEV